MLVKQNESSNIFCGIVGSSSAIRDIFELIKKVSDTDSTVLITGESGTGKELVARAIHFISKRKDNRFICVNCGAIPDGLMESELFGHEKGAFTGSIKTRIGKFEASNKGSIFLDEIAEMSYSMQVKLLRALQEQEIERVGAANIIKIDSRVIAATNKNIEEEIKNKRFRDDLYYRLNVIPINIPPLRERRDDILLLIDYFLKIFNDSKGKEIKSISSDALEFLKNYSWPGNVRELENIMERMIVLNSSGTIEIKDLPEKILKCNGKQTISIKTHYNELRERDYSFPKFYLPENGLILKNTIEDIERKFILQALDRTNWVKNKASQILGLNRTTLVEKMKKLGIRKTVS